jgi:protein TonB
MNGTRDLIWGIALSLLFHGIFLGLPFSSGGQRLIPTHQSIPVEISLVELKGHEGGPPRMKLALRARPERVRQSVSIRRGRVMKKRKQSQVALEEKPIPVLREKPFIPLTEKKTLTPIPEPLSPAPGPRIENNVSQPGEEGAKRTPSASPLPSAENQIRGEDLRASLIPEGKNSSRSYPTTLAIPRYDRNPTSPYPRIARRRGYEGVVVLMVEILPNGRVGELRVRRSSGHHMLDRSALKTVKKWRFIPAKRGEEPIRIWVDIPIKFQLDKEEP